MRLYASTAGSSTWNWGSFGGSQTTDGSQEVAIILPLALVAILCICGMIPFWCARLSNRRMRSRQRSGGGSSAEDTVASGSARCSDERRLSRGQTAQCTTHVISAKSVPPVRISSLSCVGTVVACFCERPYSLCSRLPHPSFSREECS